MAAAVVFTTPGLIDIRAFTTFGLNAKPMTQNPIGFFGTGLKYAVAVLCRLGAQPRLFIGRDEYQFYVRQTDFRGKDFGCIRMRRKRWSLIRSTHHDLPYTTELGKTWEAWQAFRELESNTRDEKGATAVTNHEQGYLGAEGTTTFIVESAPFVEAYHDMDKTFLPGGLSVREDATAMQVMDRPTRHIYYRGLRVRDLEKPALYTYNILSQAELTEDRTLKYDHQARVALARHVVTSHDLAFIEAVLTADDQHWEHNLDMDWVSSETPSDEFRGVAERRREALNPSARRYYGAWSGSSGRPGYTPSTFEAHPRPWAVSGGSVHDANGIEVLWIASTVNKLVGEKQVAQDLIDLVNADE